MIDELYGSWLYGATVLWLTNFTTDDHDPDDAMVNNSAARSFDRILQKARDIGIQYLEDLADTR